MSWLVFASKRFVSEHRWGSHKIRRVDGGRRRRRCRRLLSTTCCCLASIETNTQTNLVNSSFLSQESTDLAVSAVSFAEPLSTIPTAKSLPSTILS